MSEIAGLPPDSWMSAENSVRQESRVPVWHFESGALWDAYGIVAWNDGVELDGWLAAGPTVDVIQRDAQKVLAAVAWHRRAGRR